AVTVTRIRPISASRANRADRSSGGARVASAGVEDGLIALNSPVHPCHESITIYIAARCNGVSPLSRASKRGVLQTPHLGPSPLHYPTFRRRFVSAAATGPSRSRDAPPGRSARGAGEGQANHGAAKRRAMNVPSGW